MSAYILVVSTYDFVAIFKHSPRLVIMNKKPMFAPKKVFEQILKYAPIPTIDLIIEYDKGGFVVVKRKYPPYKNVWALPGLRIYRGEGIESAIRRIAADELGLKVDVKDKRIVGQFVGKFRTENKRQDISTCYCVKAFPNQLIRLNRDHFSSFKITKDIPKKAGAMYRHHISEYLKLIDPVRMLNS